MVDIESYRARIGNFNNKILLNSGGHRGSRLHCSRAVYLGGCNIFLILYTVFILYFISLSMSIIIHTSQSSSYYNLVHPTLQFYILSDTVPFVPYSASIHLKLAYLTLMSYLIRRIISVLSTLKKDSTESHNLVKIIFGNFSKRSSHLLYSIAVCLFALNFIMICIINPSMLNPGPISSPQNCNLSVYFQNVQGLVPFSNLNDDHPYLDNTKILELNSYINTKKPDIVMLNETWLKKSIKNREVIENPNYKIVRTDRTVLSHRPTL